MKKRYQSKFNNQKLDSENYQTIQQIQKPKKQQYIHQNYTNFPLFNCKNLSNTNKIHYATQQNTNNHIQSKKQSNHKSFYVDRFFNKLHVTHDDDLFLFNEEKIQQNVGFRQRFIANQRKLQNSERSLNRNFNNSQIQNQDSRNEQNMKSRRKSEIKNSINGFLSPVKKLENELAQYIKEQFLHIQKMKPIKLRDQIESRRKRKTNQQSKISTSIIQKSNQNTQVKLSKFKIQNPINQKINSTRPKSQQKSIIPRNNDTLNQFVVLRKYSKKDHFIFGLNNRILSQDNKLQSYQDFLWKINFSNGIYTIPQQDLVKHYKVYIGPGNNSMLIKSLFRKRFWWVISDKLTEDTNFVWTQLKNNQFFKYQKPFKQIASNFNPLNILTEIANKNKQISDETKQSLSQYHSNIFSLYDLKMWEGYYLNNKLFQEKFPYKIYQRRSKLLKMKNATRINALQNIKIHNHFDSNYYLGNKKAMFYSMKKYYQLNNLKVFDYLPITFHICKGLQDQQYLSFIKIFNQFNQKKLNQKTFRNIWIVKPGQFTNRGTGITVCSDLQSIKSRLRSKQKNNNGKQRTFIIQKYIQKPFLYFKRKFDIRHYMMITCINGQYKGYWYQQGYIRTTSYQYNINNCKDNFIHLTNDAIQKNSNQYGRFEKGNKISYTQFQKYLDNYHKVSKFDFFKMVLPKMKQITTDAVRAGYFLLDQHKKQHNFQIFGLDFMIDQEFKPWLIEINTNPCLELSSPLLAKLIPNLIENALKIALDPIFQPPYNWAANKKFQFGENFLQNNKFVMIFDEILEGQQIQQLYKNIDKIDKNMGQIQQQNEQYQDDEKQLLL